MEILSANFIKSASNLSECPETNFPEIAFIGRSNVGKSSLINMLTQRNQLAKASKIPGKTQLLNYFLINNQRYLVDLPGYWYAKHSKEKRIDWMDRMQDYFTKRKNLQMIFILIDWSIPPQNIDLEFMQVLSEEQLDFEIIVSKIDKVNQKDLHKNLNSFKKIYLEMFGIEPDLSLISNSKQRWRKELLNKISNYIN